MKSLALQLSWELHLLRNVRESVSRAHGRTKQRTPLDEATVRALVSMGVAAHIERPGGLASGARTEELVTLLLCYLRRR